MKNIIKRFKELKKESEKLEKVFGKHAAKVKAEAIKKINDAGFLCLPEDAGRKWKSRHKHVDVKGLKVLETTYIKDENLLDFLSEPWNKEGGLTFEVVDESPELIKALKKNGFYQVSEKCCPNRSLWHYRLY